MTGISGWRGAAAVVVIAFLAVCGAGLYAGGGKFPAVSTEKNIIKAMPAPSGSGAGDVDGRIAGLASRLKENPNDAEGWRMLGWSYFNTQRYANQPKPMRGPWPLSRRTQIYSLLRRRQSFRPLEVR